MRQPGTGVVSPYPFLHPCSPEFGEEDLEVADLIRRNAEGLKQIRHDLRATKREFKERSKVSVDFCDAAVAVATGVILGLLSGCVGVWLLTTVLPPVIAPHRVPWLLAQAHLQV